jgi:GNAT superfamily N-acetyltransferase
MSVSWHFATERDLPALAELNAQLIEDEGHSNPMSVQQLESRMSGWLGGDYRAVIFREGDRVVAYALYRPSDGRWEGAPSGVYLRQFFVVRDRRRHGIGSDAIGLLRREVWSPGCRITLETLLHNAKAQAFWRAVGFHDYSVTFEWTSGERAS